MKGVDDMTQPNFLENHPNKEKILALQVEREGHLRAALSILETVAYCRQKCSEIDRQIADLFDEPYNEEIKELAAQYKEIIRRVRS